MRTSGGTRPDSVHWISIAICSTSICAQSSDGEPFEDTNNIETTPTHPARRKRQSQEKKRRSMQNNGLPLKKANPNATTPYSSTFPTTPSRHTIFNLILTNRLLARHRLLLTIIRLPLLPLIHILRSHDPETLIPRVPLGDIHALVGPPGPDTDLGRLAVAARVVVEKRDDEVVVLRRRPVHEHRFAADFGVELLAPGAELWGADREGGDFVCAGVAGALVEEAEVEGEGCGGEKEEEGEGCGVHFGFVWWD